ETVLADFDHARDDFEDALGQVPDEAMRYKPEGDDYTIGGIIMHVTNSMRMYALLLGLMREAEFQEVRLVAYPGGEAVVEGDPTADWVEGIPTLSPEEALRNREAALSAMEAAHDRLAAQLRDLLHDDFSRQSPVYYPGATETFPTSGADILRWQTDHYREHVPQVLQMLEQWQKEKA
ncbi:MAG TPA: DinB family protein, partial [Chloroflexia bacterium]